jgi:ribonuclease BN (tRNA processing enzyme)
MCRTPRGPGGARPATAIARTAALLAAVALAGAARADDALQVIVLGSGGSRPSQRAASSAAVVLNGKLRLVVDAGSGSFARLGESRLALDDLRLFLLTHLHADHSAELPSFLGALATTQRAEVRVRVFGPAGNERYPGTSAFVDAFMGPSGFYRYLDRFGQPVAISVREIARASGDPEVLVEAEGLRVLAASTRHGDAPALAYRVEALGRSVVFSGDIDPSGLPALQRLAAGADLLYFNCAVLDPPGSPADLYTRHTPPARIGEVAQAAHVRSLALSHLAPLVEQHQDEVRASVRARYGGPLELVHDLERLDVTAARARPDRN